ncbi:leucine rich repeat containing 51 [Trichomycterus rosablanca]|uniref:leucine rich repeat containing 51 n=1 Tax=Trichomycterus rosablanca TaxID=2290929 RepID=UPI002F35A00C
MFEAPVDFSFKSLTSVTDVLSEEANMGVRAPKKNTQGKYKSRALRLNNNVISDMTGLMDTLCALFMEPTHISWIDLSFNEISHIHPVFTELVELRVLYLHGNNVGNLSEVDKLGVLPFLHTITLHGNTMENKQGYRSYVISALPHLKMMDFSAITKQERAMALKKPGRNRKPTSRGAKD